MPQFSVDFLMNLLPIDWRNPKLRKLISTAAVGYLPISSRQISSFNRLFFLPRLSSDESEKKELEPSRLNDLEVRSHSSIEYASGRQKSSIKESTQGD